MTRIHADVHRRGGVAATHELLRDGHSSHDLTRAVRSGEVVRIRQGHYGCPELTSNEIQAVRVGGVATGVAGAHLLGIWAPPSAALAVRVDPHARALRRRGDARRRLTPSASTIVSWAARTTTGTRTRASVEDCLIDAADHVRPRELFAMVESARHLGFLSASALARLRGALAPDCRLHIRAAGSASESGGESLLRFDLLARHIAHAQQVLIPGVGRVDFVIGDGLVIEADGAEFHADPASFETDRRRDAILAARGYRVLRFSYTQIRERPHEVWAAIEAALLRGDHWRAGR